jgi:hypothetical protein
LILASCCKITSIGIEGGVMQKGSCQRQDELLRVAASSNWSLGTDTQQQKAAAPQVLRAGQLHVYVT